MINELESWYKPLLDWGVLTDRTKSNIDLLYENNIVYPKRENVFRAFRESSYNNTKVVMIFQDPYWNGTANGIATAVEGNKIPVTLKNMFIQLQKEYPHTIEEDYRFANVNPNLNSWCKQGVLMLNTALTVEKDNPGSHLKMWSSWTKTFIEKLDQDKKVVWVLFDKEIQKYSNLIKNGEVLKIVHPAAEAYSGGKAGFFGSDVFKSINNRLTQKIKWHE